MKAMVLTACRRMELRDIPKPELRPDGLLVRVEAAALCNTTDYRSYAAENPDDAWPSIPWPVVLGHELCGAVVGVGEDIHDWREGDRIAGWGVSHGAFAEYCHLTPGEMATIHLPADFPAEEGPLFEPACGVLRYLIRPQGWPIQPGSRVLVAGLGPSGLLYARLAELLGATEIWALDRNEPRRAMAPDFGATRVFASIDDVVATAEAEGVTLDAILDSTGADLRESYARLVRPGTFVAPYGIGFDWDGVGGSLGGVPIEVGAADTDGVRAALRQVGEWVTSGDLRLSDLISRHIGLEDIPETLEELQQRPKSLAKVIVIP
ncbi:MAG: alcohol dehydrogenase catalytic domain-containing protein [Nitrospiraceae bacterium]|nr:alcohol dehydrogenase catalytic domain-containing protein [Nitrospiraceae bacterium]